MPFRTLAIFSLLVLQSVATIASPVGTRADDELVRVPGGFLPKSNVHIVPQGGKVVHTPDLVQLFNAEGKLLHSAQLNGSKSTLSHLNNSLSSSLRARQSEDTGDVFAVFEASSIFAFSGIWTVPPLPQQNAGQLLQYFIGVGPPSLDPLLFPVLQYGTTFNGGGAFWSLSTWLLTQGQAFATNITEATQTSPFNTITAFTLNDDEFEDPPPGTDIWEGVFSGFQGTELLIETAAGSLNTAVVALETANAFSEASKPDQTTNLDNLAIQQTEEGAFVPSPIPWQLQSDAIEGITIRVDPESSVETFGGLQIQYAGEAF